MTDPQRLKDKRTDRRLTGMLQQLDTTLEQATQSNLKVIATLNLLADLALVAPRKARNLGTGRKPRKLVDVTQWVRAEMAQVPSD